MSDQGSPPSEAASSFRYLHSAGFPALLGELGISLAVTTYQAGKLMLVRSDAGRLSTLLRSFEQPMGLAVHEELGSMILGTRRMVWTLRSAPEIAGQLDPPGRHDACFVPREAHVTGDIRSHEIVMVGAKPWIVNTLLSCLCTIDDPDYGFVPRWRPDFIDRLAAEDRCHLNGIAVHNGQIRFVTALGETNEPEGWKPGKANGGVLIDFSSGETVAHGLSMPHSPRIHRGRTFVLDSGKGHLSIVDERSGSAEAVAVLPGYTRGLAFHGRHAFVGLSKIREAHIFSGLPVVDRLREPERQCGVSVVDLESGRIVEFLSFEAGVTEVFDVQVLRGTRSPTVVGFQDRTLDGILIAPPRTWQPVTDLPSAGC